MKDGKTIGIIAAAVLAVWIYGKAVPSDPKPTPNPPSPSATPTEPSDAYRKLMAMGDVQKRLRDPSSADFGPMQVRTGVVCGTVNSKNGFGGMTGQQRFMSRMGGITAFADDVQDNGFDDAWRSICGA